MSFFLSKHLLLHLSREWWQLCWREGKGGQLLLNISVGYSNWRKRLFPKCSMTAGGLQWPPAFSFEQCSKLNICCLQILILWGKFSVRKKCSSSTRCTENVRASVVQIKIMVACRRKIWKENASIFACWPASSHIFLLHHRIHVPSPYSILAGKQQRERIWE